MKKSKLQSTKERVEKECLTQGHNLGSWRAEWGEKMATCLDCPVSAHLRLEYERISGKKPRRVGYWVVLYFLQSEFIGGTPRFIETLPSCSFAGLARTTETQLA